MSNLDNEIHNPYAGIASYVGLAPLMELLDGDGFIAGLGRQRCVKDVVDGVEKVISHPSQPSGPALPEQDEVIDKHAGMCYGQLVGSIG